MTLTISFIDAPIPADAPQSVSLTRPIAVALVQALAEGPRSLRSLIFTNDHQIGYLAKDVTPMAVLTALDRMIPAVRVTAWKAIADLVQFAEADGRLITVRTNDDQSWMPGITPVITVSEDRADVTSLRWTKGHFVEALTRLGLTFGEGETFETTARELTTACEGRIDEDSEILETFARAALNRGGPDARIVAA